MSVTMRFQLSFEGAEADEHLLEFYDAAEALRGFQRTLALTTHLVLNGEIITEAPSLKGARVMITSPEAGSWKVIATVGMLMSGVSVIGTASRDSVYGHLATSLYDYAINESLGFHVDFDKTLGVQYDQEARKRHSTVPRVTQSQADSLIEKIERSVKQMHRPIYASGTAETARVESRFKRQRQTIAVLDAESYEYIHLTTKGSESETFVGKVSSYNVNTFKGRVYVPNEGRPVPFELSEGARDFYTVEKITRSLSLHALSTNSTTGLITFTGYRFESSSGRLKQLLITGVQ